MTRDEYVAQVREWGAAGDLSLGHEQTTETTGMDLADNLMDAEPIQTFDGDMGILVLIDRTTQAQGYRPGLVEPVLVGFWASLALLSNQALW
jgi:hypothetical protein